MSKFPALTGAVPILETERLVMRSHRVDDLKDCAAMWADPEVVHHISGSTFAEDQVWSKCLCYAGLWSLLGFGYWALGHFGPIKTACIIAPENMASIRLAEKCGYREISRTTFKGSPTIIYHRALCSLTDNSEADISSALPIF